MRITNVHVSTMLPSRGCHRICKPFAVAQQKEHDPCEKTITIVLQLFSGGNLNPLATQLFVLSVKEVYLWNPHSLMVMLSGTKPLQRPERGAKIFQSTGLTQRKVLRLDERLNTDQTLVNTLLPLRWSSELSDNPQAEKHVMIERHTDRKKVQENTFQSKTWH